MNRNKFHYISGRNSQNVSKSNIAYHEAGHAAAIYFNNKLHKLPPVFFQIILLNNNKEKENLFLAKTIDGDSIANIRGGRLIQSFPPLDDMSDDYMLAFEADITNILIGPLAEAKHIHECDNELFDKHLININDLNFYGGRLDLQLADEYLQSLYIDTREQNAKLMQLFYSAFEFVENYRNWKAISQLARHIDESNKNIIDYDEAVSILENDRTTKR